MTAIHNSILYDEKSIAANYEDGPADYEAYTLFQQMDKGGMSRRQIARACGATEGKIKSWLHGSGPRYTRATRELKRMKILPLSYRDPKFKDVMNVLASWAYFSGTVQETGPTFSESKEKLDVLAGIAEKHLGLDAIYYTRDDNNGVVMRLSGNGSSAVGRALECMGVPRNNGKKADIDSPELPWYLSKLYRSSQNDAKMALRQALSVFFLTRTYISRGRQCISFATHRYETKARELAYELTDMINSMSYLKLDKKKILINPVVRSGTAYNASMPLMPFSFDGFVYGENGQMLLPEFRVSITRK